MNGFTSTAGRRQSTRRDDGAGAGRTRILIVDDDRDRRRSYGEALEIAGIGEADSASTGDEALDILGATRQQCDIVAAWMPLSDADGTDLAGILRRCRSPVRLLAMTELDAVSFPLAGRLAGISGVDTSGTPRGFVRLVRDVLQTGSPIATIVRDREVPATLDHDWALRIYGQPPGSRFHAELD